MASMIGYRRNTEVMMRRLTSLFHRSPEPVRPAAKPPQHGVAETICAPKAQPRRCLNEGGHKAYR